MIIKGSVKHILLFYENQLKANVNKVVINDKEYPKMDIYINYFVACYGGTFDTKLVGDTLMITDKEDFEMKHSVEVSLCE